MARRKKKNQKMKTFLKFFIIITFALFLIYGIYNRTLYFFQHASIFSIDEIVKSPSLQFVQSRHLERLAKKNIFLVDLKAVERRVQSEYSSIDRLRIIRQLPNRIIVTAEKRDPFLIIALESQDVVLDERGVVLDDEALSLKRGVPYISGIGDAYSPKKGKKLNGQRVDVALKILRSIHGNDYLKRFLVKSIDIGNLSQIRVYIDSIEVVFDRFKIENKVEMLGLLLSDAGIPIDQINYLDLRFKEPIINKK